MINESMYFFCGQQVELIHVHRHYQYPVCKTNALLCCDEDDDEPISYLRILKLPNLSNGILGTNIKDQTFSKVVGQTN